MHPLYSDSNPQSVTSCLLWHARFSGKYISFFSILLLHQNFAKCIPLYSVSVLHTCRLYPNIVIVEEFVEICQCVTVCYHGFRLQVTVTGVWLNCCYLSMLHNHIFFYTILKTTRLFKELYLFKRPTTCTHWRASKTHLKMSSAKVICCIFSTS